ncbi:MAG: hypothetical protein J7518_11550 [Nocardioidaceae bacterium]|nr:hypothetical protein [Nocardioidaceae bacterium]
MIGTGSAGRALAGGFRRIGHDVVVGSTRGRRGGPPARRVGGLGADPGDLRRARSLRRRARNRQRRPAASRCGCRCGCD